MKSLDDVDRAMLRIVQEDGRASLVDLARQVNLSPAATHSRLRALESQGFIERYAAIVNPDKLGYDLTCFIQISFQLHAVEWLDKFLQDIRVMPEVIECYKVTGEYDYLLKVLVRNHRDLERFLTEKLNRMHGIARTHTSIAVNEIKLNGPVHIE